MSETKHTPGPWKYHDDADGEESNPLITFDHPELGPTPVVVGTCYWEKADGPLLAAAPNLLETLEKIAKMKTLGQMSIAPEIAKTALAKAKQ